MRKIKKKNYNSWQSYYWDYQKILAEDYYIPYLSNEGNILKLKKNSLSVIDIGCGNGGFVDAVRSAVNISTNKSIKGIDIKTFKSWDNSDTSYRVHNILKDNNKDYQKKYDLVILRDVI